MMMINRLNKKIGLYVSLVLDSSGSWFHTSPTGARNEWGSSATVQYEETSWVSKCSERWGKKRTPMMKIE